VVRVAAPASLVLPQGLEFTPGHVGVIDGATLTEWQRSALGDGPATVTFSREHTATIGKRWPTVRHAWAVCTRRSRVMGVVFAL
jgi:hypothetical protein